MGRLGFASVTLATALAVALAGCDGKKEDGAHGGSSGAPAGQAANRPDIKEQHFLQPLGFSQPLSLFVSLRLANDGMGRVGMFFDNNSYIGLLWKAGYLRIIPYPSAPGWQFSVLGPISNNAFQLVVATRVITGHSDERRWTEGSIDYFAETISYRFNFDPRLKTVLPRDLTDHAYTLRLVLKNDPAYGTWRLADRGNTFQGQEASEIRGQLIELGRTFIPAVVAEIRGQEGNAEASAGTEFMNSLGLEKSPDGAAFYQRSTGLAFLRTAGQLPPGGTFSAAQAYCARNGAEGLTWHMATRTEMNHLVTKRGNDWIIDTAHYLLWQPSLGPETYVAVNSWKSVTIPNAHYVDAPPGDTPSPRNDYLLYHLQAGGIVTASDQWTDNKPVPLNAVPLFDGTKFLCAATLR